MLFRYFGAFRLQRRVREFEDVALPDYQSLMLPTLLAASEGELRVGALVDRLANQLNLTTEQKAELLPSGRQTIFSNRVHWAKTYLCKAGLLLATRRGHFVITPRGRDVLARRPARIDNELLIQFDEFRRFKERSGQNGGVIDTIKQQSMLLAQRETPDEIMRGAHRQIEESLAQELLDRVRAASPAFFERLIANLLRSMRYGDPTADAIRVIGRSGDDGVDGVIDQDALGLDRVYIQAKRYAAGNNIGPGAIRDFFGSLDRHKAAKGLFVTTSTFSSSARETADLLSKRIVLIDGEQLTKLMIRHDVGCRLQETLHIKKIDEEFFD